jgi:hypothetical protein
VGKNSNNISQILSSNSLEKRRCFLLGGGPSLEDFDYSILINEFTIGVNKTLLIFNPTINYSMDPRFYENAVRPPQKRDERLFHEAWVKYTGLKVLLCPKKDNRLVLSDDIYIVTRITQKILSLDINQGIYPGTNSGFGAFMLAIAMGCKEIYLLGYDMKVVNDKTHWHKGYPNQNLKDCKIRLEKFNNEMEEFSEIIKKQNIKVVNLNKNSALECFPKDHIKNIM